MLSWFSIIPEWAIKLVVGAIALLLAITYIRADAVSDYKRAAQLAVAQAVADARQTNVRIEATSRAEVTAAQMRVAELERQLTDVSVEIASAQKDKACKISIEAIRAINKAR